MQVVELCFNAFFKRKEAVQNVIGVRIEDFPPATRGLLQRIVYGCTPPSQWFTLSWTTRLINKLVKEKGLKTKQISKGGQNKKRDEVFVDYLPLLTDENMYLSDNDQDFQKKIRLVKTFWDNKKKLDLPFVLPNPQTLRTISSAIEFWYELEGHPILKGQYTWKDILQAFLGLEPHLDLSQLRNRVRSEPIFCLENGNPFMYGPIRRQIPPMEIYSSAEPPIEKIIIEVCLFEWKEAVDVKVNFDAVEITLMKKTNVPVDDRKFLSGLGMVCQNPGDTYSFTIVPSPLYDVNSIEATIIANKNLLQISFRKKVHVYKHIDVSVESNEEEETLLQAGPLQKRPRTDITG